jgi:hypothetical protein
MIRSVATKGIWGYWLNFEKYAVHPSILTATMKSCWLLVQMKDVTPGCDTKFRIVFRSHVSKKSVTGFSFDSAENIQNQFSP